MGVTSQGRVSGRFFDIKVSLFGTDAQIDRAELPIAREIILLLRRSKKKHRSVIVKTP